MGVPGEILILLAIGLAGGLSSGIFGIGGGVVIIPALVYLLDYSQHKATGTSLAVLLPPVGIAAFLEYYRHRNVDLPAALTIAAAMIVGAWVGAVFANRLSGSMLRLAFGIFMSILGISLIYNAVKRLGWF